ncbi:MAG: ATP-dependent Clp protease proteolytic subunit [Pseudomonadota bacterium]
MTSPENPLAKLAAAHLPTALPASVEKMLPGGLRNRLVQWGLGLLLTFGFSFVVKRMLEKRERKQRALAPRPVPPAVAAPRREMQAASARAPAHAALAADAGSAISYPQLGRPHINLSGQVDQAMYTSFSHQLAAAPSEGPLVIAISTLGGDPEVARLMGDEIRLLRDYHGRETLFLGKVSVYSAGTVLMAAFPADKRFLTRGTRLLVHERVMTFYLGGSLKTLTETMRSHLGEVEHAVKVEDETFRDLVAGSSVTLEELRQRAPADWYIDAEEARTLGLIHDVI